MVFEVSPFLANFDCHIHARSIRFTDTLDARQSIRRGEFPITIINRSNKRVCIPAGGPIIECYLVFVEHL